MARKFSMGVQPSDMSPEDAEAYWKWYTHITLHHEKREIEPLPREDEDYEE